MAIELITGRAGEPHVDSADVGALNAALFGAGAYVLEGIEAELVDANNVLITAGEMLCEGRHVRITGEGETLTIENGLSAYKRHDIVAAHYLRGEDGIESVTLVVIKGSNSSTSPQDPPMPRHGKVIEGASEAYWPLYRIVIDGLTPQTPAFIAQRQALYQLGAGTEIPANSDLNDYTKPGVYFVRNGATGQTIANMPLDVGISGILIVEQSFPQQHDDSCVQTFKVYGTHANVGLEFKRNVDRTSTAGWHPWVCSGGIDTIVAEGTQGEKRWRKWASGMVEIFIRDPNTINNQSQWSNTYYQQVSVSLPISIAGKTLKSATATCESIASVSDMFMLSNGQTLNYTIHAGHNLNGYTIWTYIHLVAI